MKGLLFWLLLGCFIPAANAQMAFEAHTGTRLTQYFAFQQRSLDSAARWNLFASQLYARSHASPDLAIIGLENQLSHQFLPWLGVSAGVAMGNDGFQPNVGLALDFANKKGDFFVSAYPTYAIGGSGGLELFFVSQYAPRGRRSWAPFVQWIGGLSTAFSKPSPEQQKSLQFAGAEHMLRVGLNYRQKWQFGLGLDWLRAPAVDLRLLNPGLFVRFAID